MPKILITESLNVETLESLVKARGGQVYYADGGVEDKKGLHFLYQPDISVADIEQRLDGYEALVVRPKEVTAKAIAAAKSLKLIVRGGAGMNSVDLAAAAKHKVVVENTPGQNSISTAEYAFALMMELVAKRQIARSNQDTRAGNPGLAEHYAGQELAGKKLGVVGLGHIGLAMAKRAEAFDMEVAYFNRSKKEVSFPFFETLDALCDWQPDVISLHIPSSPETDGIIDAGVFSRMKHGTVLINTARPQLVDPQAFGRALADGTLESAGIDGDMDLVEPFIKVDPEGKCLITHHIADATLQAQQKITRQVVEQLYAFFEDGQVINQVG